MNNSFYMDIAIEEAKMAFLEEEVPVGAVIVFRNEIISRGHNEVRRLNDPTAHAEILVIRRACEKLRSYYLDGCKMFITLEPCGMCLKAIMLARIKKICFGAYSFNTGAIFHRESVLQCNRDYNLEVVGGFRETSCSDLLKEFFIARRS